MAAVGILRSSRASAPVLEFSSMRLEMDFESWFNYGSVSKLVKHRDSLSSAASKSLIESFVFRHLQEKTGDVENQ